MDTVLQQLINGLSLGAIYALIALGYTMVYGVLRLINFAHGDVYMLGAFAGYYLANALDLDASPSILGAIVVTLGAIVRVGDVAAARRRLVRDVRGRRVRRGRASGVRPALREPPPGAARRPAEQGGMP